MPTLGRPTSATRSPSRSTRPRSAPASSRSTLVLRLGNQRRQLRRVGRRHLFFGEVDARLDADQRLQRRVARALATSRRKLALKLTQRQAAARVGFGVDERHDRLGLRQIDPAIEKGAQCHLAGLSSTRASRQRHFEDAAQRQRATMRRYLDDIFASIGAWGVHEGRQRLIDYGVVVGGINRVAVEQLVRGRRLVSSARGCAGRKMRSPTTKASGPLKRTMPMPPTPGGVAIAAMVSS